MKKPFPCSQAPRSFHHVPCEGGRLLLPTPGVKTPGLVLKSLRDKICAASPIRRFALSPPRPFSSPHLLLYKCLSTSHIPDPYVAVDFNPDLAHRPGDCLHTADLGGPHAAAA